jgi:hypothetical protein
MLDITRNQYFFAGVVLLFLGIELRLIESADLNPELTKLLGEQASPQVASMGSLAQSLTLSERPVLRKNVRPPDWAGWLFLSAGSVLILHSWAMKKPEG